MFDYSKNNLVWIADMLHSLPAGVYDSPSRLLSGVSIGQHVRHILEMYQSLLHGYQNGVVEYDKRKRDKRIEIDTAFAEQVINEVMQGLPQADKPLQVITEIEGKEFVLQSNYQREVMYNLEHAIHHMALIKVAVIEMTNIRLPEEFGVAPTTLKYRAQCVQ